MTPKRHTVVVKSSKTRHNKNKTHHNTKVQFYDSCQNAIKSQFIEKQPMQFRRRRKKMLVIDISE